MYSVRKILIEARRLAKEFPEAIYRRVKNSPACSYSKGSVSKGPKTKGCLIGQAIRNVYPDLFSQIKVNSDTESIDDISELSDCSDKNRLLNMQCNQDSDVPWGKC